MTSLQEQAKAAYYDNNGKLHSPISEAEEKNTDYIVFNGDSGDKIEEQSMAKLTEIKIYPQMMKMMWGQLGTNSYLR